MDERSVFDDGVTTVILTRQRAVDLSLFEVVPLPGLPRPDARVTPAPRVTLTDDREQALVMALGRRGWASLAELAGELGIGAYHLRTLIATLQGRGQVVAHTRLERGVRGAIRRRVYGLLGAEAA